MLHPRLVALFGGRICRYRYYWVTKSECAYPGRDSTQNKRKGGLHGETYWLKVVVGV